VPAAHASTAQLAPALTPCCERLDAATQPSLFAPQGVLTAARTGDPAGVAALLSRFGSRLEFGTAGLRGEMAAGTARMNDLTVLQAAQGLADYVAATHGGAGAASPPCVVIGWDHRARGTINSRRFAVLTAAALTARGIAVHLFAKLACTPLVPFGVLHLGAVAGVMVTASHNPKADDGYKVYDANGAQIVSPVDKAIAGRIGALENQAPWAHADLLTPSDGGLATAYALPTDELLARLAAVRGALLPGYGPGQAPLDDAVTGAYVAAVTASQCRHGASNAAGCPVKVAYTAMHGVGRPFAQAMAAAFGLPPYVETPAQVQPDPDFPTVDYPNPEEGKGGA
jgi:phosphomannomutase